MPNWCYNNATFSHEDPREVERLVIAVEKSALMQEFHPCPKELLEVQADMSERKDLLDKYGYSDWYGWCLNNWGTKWDISTDGFEDITGENTVSVSFSTAWSPPIAFYEKMVELGWKVSADYSEEGMGFVGYFNEEDGDQYYELNFEAFDEDWKDEYPPCLWNMIEMQYESWQEWQLDQAQEEVDDQS